MDAYTMELQCDLDDQLEEMQRLVSKWNLKGRITIEGKNVHFYEDEGEQQ